MRRRGFLAGTVAVAASALAGGNDAAEDPNDEDADPPARIVESRLVREEEGTEEETVRVEGVIERTRDAELTYLEVRASFYGEDGEVLDTTVEQVTSIDDGDRWEFVVEYPGIGEAAARIVDHDVAIADHR